MIYNGDSLKILKEIPDKSVDMLLTDPPYKIITGGKRKSTVSFGGIIKDNKQLMRTIPEFKEWLPECFRVLKDNTHAYFFINFINLNDMINEIEKAGFKIHTLLVWQKNNSGFNRWYLKNCEYVIFARKGKAKKIKIGGSKTVHQFNNPRNKVHPTEKPVDLLEMYILNSSDEGDVVLDPFMGSGSTGVACKNTNRKFIGIELEIDYFEIAKKRIYNE